ncbi:hypothetical protein [Micromonospora sp. WMMD736]|uniref:hypothetical protein n=1 Tax=Micromonospora sp. WMMD736 TaxID=3404112 RepID=UPI003B9592EF
MTISMYCVTRGGQRIAGSLAVPYAAAVLAANTLNREHRRKDEFDVAPDPTATAWEQMQAPRMASLVGAVLEPTITCYSVAAYGQHRMVEVALTDECDHGCKVLECECGLRTVSHRRIYGCPLG